MGWLAPAGNSGLDALWSALAHALDDAGIARGKAETLAPHVTVVRGLEDGVGEAAVDPISWPVGDFVLVHSHGGTYDVIDRWRMRMPE